MRLLLLLIAAPLITIAVLAQAAPDHSGQDSTYHPDALSGMYTFLHEGEFVEIDFEEQHRLTGFISRFGDLDSDRGAFLDHMFSKGEYSGDTLSFTTKAVHGVWFEFKGKISTDKSKQPGSEGYAIVHGTLIQYKDDNNKKTSAKSAEVSFKSFPHDLSVPEPKK
ncbi:MAG TPA: hypothetical protein VKW78_00555 [Terriglobales bacterium]|nr:hypothetical protein [Terriglobales bacterium]